MHIKPKGQNELSEKSIEKFKITLRKIRLTGYSDGCPLELKNFSDCVHDCMACRQAFPKEGDACPCNSDYSKNHLIKRIIEILKTGKV